MCATIDRLIAGGDASRVAITWTRLGAVHGLIIVPPVLFPEFSPCHTWYRCFQEYFALALCFRIVLASELLFRACFVELFRALIVIAFCSSVFLYLSCTVAGKALSFSFNKVLCCSRTSCLTQRDQTPFHVCFSASRSTSVVGAESQRVA